MEITIKLPAGNDRVSVLGSSERNLKMIRETLGVSIVARDNDIHVKGERPAVVAARNVLYRLANAAETQTLLQRSEVLDLISEESSRVQRDTGMIAEISEERQIGHWDGKLDVYARGRAIKPRSDNQDRYMQAIRRNDVVFAIGPAGTGKTYLAVAAAVHLLKTDRVAKLILVRPAVEAGEKLGYLPGDMQAKVNPYLRPLLDALQDMMEYPTIRRFMENDVVEVVPLAYMRGRTLNNACIILDEAQNATRGQMKMFLTRLGHGSKMIVTGDVTQIDLADPRESGLIDAARRFMYTRGVEFVQLEKQDVVRHPIVQRIIEAYGEDDRRSALEASEPSEEPPR